MGKRFLAAHRPDPVLWWAVVAAWAGVLVVAVYYAQDVWLGAFVLVASALTLFAIWPRKAHARSEEFWCSFCGKSRAEVNKLIAGPDVCICDECVRLSDDIIAEGSGHPSDRVIIALQGALQSLLAKDDAIRLVDAWLALGDDAEKRTSAARFARAGGNFAAAAYALDGLPEDARGAGLLELASLRVVELEDQDGAALIDRVDTGALSDHERIELRVLSAYARYDEDGADRAALVEEARAAVAELDGTSWSGSLARRLSAALEVRAALARNDVEMAETLARAASEQTPCPLTWELLAHVLEQRGDAGAHEARVKGQACCDAECPRGRRLRGQGTAPFR